MLRSRVAYPGLSAALLAAWVVLASPGAVDAQTLLDVGAANAIRADAEARQLGRNRDEAEPESTPDAATDEAAEPDAAAAPAAPAQKLDEWGDQHSIYRSETPSIAWGKVLTLALVFLAWVRSGDWVYRDAQIFSLDYEKWTPIVTLPFLVGMIAVVLLPNFWIGLAMLVLTWLLPFAAYATHHNKSVEAHQTVFTPGWFRFQLAEAGKAVGLKVGTEKRAGYLRGPQVDLIARGGADDRENQANLITARQSPGYVHVKELIAEMTELGSDRVLMDYGAEAVTVRRLIDGVWHNGDARDRESADVMLAVMKQLSNLDLKERRTKQEGDFGAQYQGDSYNCEISSQGVKTGERVVVSLKGVGMKTGFNTYADLGMREKLVQQWMEVMGAERGFVVIAAMPEAGLTTLTNVSLLETDRLMRDFVAIEDETEPEVEIENIERHFFNGPAGESPSKLIPSLSRKYPNAYVCRDLVDADTAKLLMDEVDLDRLVITTTHAKDAAEACLRILKKRAPHKEFARELAGVLCTRLIRRLCESCRVAYQPTPDLLKKLGIPAGKVEKLYRPPKPDEIDKPCKDCRGIGYQGRTALFELLIPDDQFREKLLKEPKLDTIRKSARLAGMRTMQEEGVLLVARGVTSLPELSRVLKS